MSSNLNGVLSIDLASKDYRDIGFAYLTLDKPTPEFIEAEHLGLQGKPLPGELAIQLDKYCQGNNITVIILDGPQGWKWPKSGIDHMRLSERVLNTPAKTGVIGSVKPSPVLRFVAFSISLFHSLRVDFGWQLLTGDWAKKGNRNWVVEGFPTSAWRTLGLKTLPSKSKSKPAVLRQWTSDLEKVTDLKLPQTLTHDQLQAAAMLPAAHAIAEKRSDRVILSGMDPIITRKDDVLEGWIANPLLQA